MKYFIVAALFCCGVILGGAGAAYYGMSQFKEMSGVSYDEFTKAHHECTAKYREPCQLYGGYAPISQFADK